MYFSLEEKKMWWLKDTEEELDSAKPPKNVSISTVYYQIGREHGVEIRVDGKKVPDVSVRDYLMIETSKKYKISLNSISSDLSGVLMTTEGQKSLEDLELLDYPELLDYEKSLSECVSLAEGSQYQEADVLRSIILYLIKKKKIKI